MARTVSKTLSDVVRSDIIRLEIVPQGADVLCIASYQNKDESNGQAYGPVSSFAIALTAGQKSTLVGFLDNVVLPAINAEII